MPEQSGSSSRFRENSRAPLQAAVEVQLDAFSDPLTSVTANVSSGGMFVKMKDPPPVGSLIRFKIEMGFPAGTVEGAGEVVWIRANAHGADQPAGIGVQFRFIEQEGAPLLRTAVEQALERLGPEQEPPAHRRTSPSWPRPRVEPAAPAPSAAERFPGKRSSRRGSRSRVALPSGNGKTILGLSSERAKLILLLILFAVLAAAVLF